jgi:hypothetical protein
LQCAHGIKPRTLLLMLLQRAFLVVKTCDPLATSVTCSTKIVKWALITTPNHMTAPWPGFFQLHARSGWSILPFHQYISYPYEDDHSAIPLCANTMPFDIIVPSKGDAEELASLHITAMDANLLMHAQFPNDAARQFFHSWLCKDTQDHIANDNMGVLIAQDSDTGKIASFVKWNAQRPNENEEHEPDENIPECCRREYLDTYAELTKKARRQVLGDQPHYRKSLTHSLHFCLARSGTGQASLLDLP